MVDKTGERFYEAELYRLKGTLMLQQFKVQVQVKLKKVQGQSQSPSRKIPIPDP